MSRLTGILTWALCHMASFGCTPAMAGKPAANLTHPDFSGFWILDQSLWFSGGNGPADLPEGWRGFGSFRNNPQPPLQNWAYEAVKKQRIKEHNATHADEGTDPQTARCDPAGFPDVLEFFDPLDILQRPDEVVMLTERERQLPRHIYITPEHPITDQYLPRHTGVLSNAGHSIGHWDGQVLVIKTDGLTAQPWMFSIDRIPRSDALETEERLSLSSNGNGLTDLLTIRDPKTLLHPWTLTIHWNRAPPETEAIESVCVREADAPGLK